MTSRIVLVLMAAVFLLPVWWMFTGSLQDSYGVMLMPPRLVPRHPTLENFRRLLDQPLVLRWLANTVVVVTLTVLMSVAVSTSAGYAFAYYEFPGKRVLWMVLLAQIMIPRIAMIIPRFVVIDRIGISGTLAAVILPTVFSPFGAYLARAYYGTVPRSTLEAARLDGANELQVLARVVVPISRPIVTALALFAAIGAMSDYLWQMLVLQREASHTLLIGLMRAVMKRGGNSIANLNPIGLALSASVLLLVPLLLIFVAANRYFTTALGGVE